MNKAEEILREYADFSDATDSETISLLPLTITDAMMEYAEYQAIVFAEWMQNECWIQNSNNLWYLEGDDCPEKGLTTSELYDTFTFNQEQHEQD